MDQRRQWAMGLWLLILATSVNAETYRLSKLTFDDFFVIEQNDKKLVITDVQTQKVAQISHSDDISWIFFHNWYAPYHCNIALPARIAIDTHGIKITVSNKNSSTTDDIFWPTSKSGTQATKFFEVKSDLSLVFDGDEFIFSAQAPVVNFNLQSMKIEGLSW